MDHTKDIFEEHLADNDDDSKVVINLNNKLCKRLRKCPCQELPYSRSYYCNPHMSKQIDNSLNELNSFTHYYLIYVNTYIYVKY